MSPPKPILPSSLYDTYNLTKLTTLRKRLTIFILLFIGILIYKFNPDHNKSNIISDPIETQTSESNWSRWRITSPSLWLKTTTTNKHSNFELTTSFSDAEITNWQSPTKALSLNSSLFDRLKDWRNSPLPEPAIWVQFNSKTCPDDRIGKNANLNLLGRAHLMWATMNRTHFKNKREELITYLELVEKRGLLKPNRYGKGKGIVFTAGNADTFARVLLTIKMLRENLECKLPIEIFSFPNEIPGDEIKKSIEDHHQVKFKIVKWAQKDSKRNKNFHIKASALVLCSFMEPLYLDSDNLPALLEPGQLESLWESKAYKKLGAIFWPDYWKTHADVPIWLLIGTQCRDEWEQEAGQILINKSKHLDVLLLSEYMLKDYKYWFQISDGDKDIFRYSMLALRKRWALPGKFLGAAGLSWNTQTGFCAHTMLQSDIEGRPLFVHMNLLKQIPSGISRGSTFKRTRNTKIPLLGNETSEDWGLEADMLANADANGKAIMEAPAPVRRRAALERGLVPYLHGGGNSAICADIKWSDPRSEEEKEKASDEIKWEDPLEIAQWNDDERLKDFEDKFFDMGGRTNSAAGF
ncbi:hypothetical protein CROQUDRAFT_661603 [Cronartium quercuum f. sp. fusiforme G11]|uniref:Uncharacterized protein n=1 Tax=Cronartium quercuum f. sp. fusiforme G11 TaxID=708437 RepID=A0A9P6NFE6_9BASI|nr:hypothetical protein CROQUDRAFT_661603 [Cronartium quercuum f. sp. fusiforme G11]